MPTPPESSPAQQKMRLLGLAFAGADLVFEVDPSGTVSFALGAVEQITGYPPAEFVGVNWTDLVDADDADLLGVLLDGLKPAERQGPLRVSLRPRKATRIARHGSLSVFRLPQPSGNISCALSLGGPAAPGQTARRPDGLLESGAFAAAAGMMIEEAGRAGLPVRLDLIELDGLNAAVSAMDDTTADSTRRRVAAMLRAGSYAGMGASEVATDRFALVRPAGASSERLLEGLERASDCGVKPKAAQLALDGPSMAQNLKAMRYALDRYIEDGPTSAATGFMASVQRTVREATRFKTILADRSFHLAYQPVIDLADGSLHHYEALARFDPNASPADTIRLAEELDLITDFDLVVAADVAKTLAAGDPGLKIAANLSAVSLMRPGFLDALLAITAQTAKLRPNLLLEVTETHCLADLPAANAALATLRRAGHLVCLDDFGAGAASLDYLRHLDVDFVKIDGRYVQALGSSARDGMILKHVVALCRELKVATIAEMIETAEAESLAKSLGVHFGQGWRFGKPTAEPTWKTAPTALPARRRGAVEQWG